LGHGRAKAYRHNDLGLVVDLGGKEAVAKPLGVGMSGIAAKAMTRAYHLYALPSKTQRLRVGFDWVLDAALSRPLVQLGLVQERRTHPLQPPSAPASTRRRKDLPKKVTNEEPTSSSTETVQKRHLIA